MVNLPVDPEWQCQQSGECCTQPHAVTMTTQERELIEEYAAHNLPIWRLNKLNWVSAGPGFTNLLAGPCPLYDGDKRTCTVYSVRPFNCRRFACMRPNVQLEKLNLTASNPILKMNVGCSNLRDRLLQSRSARRLYAKIERKAQRWARAHGWKDRNDQ